MFKNGLCSFSVDCSLIRLAGTRFHEEYHGDYIRMADSECEDMPVYKLSWDKFKNVYFYMYDTSWYLGPSRCSRYAYLKRDSPRMPYFSVDEPWRELRSSSYGIYPSIKVYCPGKCTSSRNLHPDTMSFCATQSQQTQNICITSLQCWTNVEDVGSSLYKCYTNVLCLLGKALISNVFTEVANTMKHWGGGFI